MIFDFFFANNANAKSKKKHIIADEILNDNIDVRRFTSERDDILNTFTIFQQLLWYNTWDINEKKSPRTKNLIFEIANNQGLAKQFHTKKSDLIANLNWLKIEFKWHQKYYPLKRCALFIHGIVVFVHKNQSRNTQKKTQQIWVDVFFLL